MILLSYLWENKHKFLLLIASACIFFAGRDCLNNKNGFIECVDKFDEHEKSIFLQNSYSLGWERESGDGVCGGDFIFLLIFLSCCLFLIWLFLYIWKMFALKNYEWERNKHSCECVTQTDWNFVPTVLVVCVGKWIQSDKIHFEWELRTKPKARTTITHEKCIF